MPTEDTQSLLNKR